MAPLGTHTLEVPRPAGAGSRVPWVAAGVFLAVAAAAALLPQGAPPHASPPPTVATETPRASFLEETSARRANLAQAIEDLDEGHPERVRLLSISWHSGEIPAWMTEHAASSLAGDPGERLITHLSAASGALRDWLVQLRDVGRERGDPEAAAQDPQVRASLLEGVLPVLLHHLEDRTIRWAARTDPTNMDTMATVSPQSIVRNRRVLEVFTDIGFALEEWGSPPPWPLLGLWTFLPENETLPTRGGDAALALLEAEIDRTRDPEELWMLGRTLLHMLAFSPWRKAVSWDRRRHGLQVLAARVEAADSPVRPRDRRLLAWRILGEEARLYRAVDRPGAAEELLGRIRAGCERLAATVSEEAALGYSAAWLLMRVGHFSEGPFYLPSKPDSALGKVMLEHVRGPRIEGAKRLQLQGRAVHRGADVGLGRFPAPGQDSRGDRPGTSPGPTASASR